MPTTSGTPGEVPNVYRLPLSGAKILYQFPIQQPADNLANELHAAGVIIRAMLNAMTPAGKNKVAKQLYEQGISPDGMTRAEEREDELSKPWSSCGPSATP